MGADEGGRGGLGIKGVWDTDERGGLLNLFCVSVNTGDIYAFCTTTYYTTTTIRDIATALALLCWRDECWPERPTSDHET
jgi:hypothetical protein